MAAAFAQFPFVRVIFVAWIPAVLVQCLVYPARHWLDLRQARLVHTLSLYGFVGVAVGSLTWGVIDGQVSVMADLVGWTPLVDFALLTGLGMFVSYFMGARYLADEATRAASAARASGGSEERRSSADASERCGREV